MKTNNIFAIDANVLLRYLLGDNQTLSPKARDIMTQMENEEIVISCDPVILAECVWVMESFYKIPKEIISSKLIGLVSADGFVLPNKKRYLHALTLFASSISHYGDACACAAAIETSEGNLLSFDKKLTSIKGITRMESV